MIIQVQHRTSAVRCCIHIITFFFQLSEYSLDERAVNVAEKGRDKNQPEKHCRVVPHHGKKYRQCYGSHYQRSYYITQTYEHRIFYALQRRVLISRNTGENVSHTDEVYRRRDHQYNPQDIG